MIARVIVGISITNFLVNNPRGTFFLKLVDTSAIPKFGGDSKFGGEVFGLLDSMIQDIGVKAVIHR